MVTLLVVICGIGLHALLVQAEIARGFDPPSVAVRAGFITAGIVVSVIVHEYGHRLAGMAFGWRCVGFGFGPFEFCREGSGWKRKRVRMLWGAFVRQMPSSMASYRQEKAVTLFCGPLASLTFGLLFAAIAWSSTDAVVFDLFARFAMISLLFVLNLIPFAKNGIGSDGYRLWQVIRGGSGYDEIVRDSLTEASTFTPLRLRDWPQPALLRLAAKDDPFNCYLAYLRAMDAGENAAAERFMRKMIALLPTTEPYSNLAWEAAYWLAAYGDDPAAAHRWAERTGGEEDPAMRLRAQAALAFVDGEGDQAQRLMKEALARIPTPAVYGADLFELDRLNQLSGFAVGALDA